METYRQLHGCLLRERGGKRIGHPRSQALVSEITESPVPDCQSNTPTLSKEEVQTLGHLTNKLVSPS